MKKIVGSVIITCMILMSLCNICYASTTFQPSITAESGSVGDTITVAVSIPANTNAAGGSFNLIYDNTKMELVDATAGDIISAFSKTVNKTYAADKVRLNFAGSETVSASGGVILNASFKLTAAGTATFSTEKFKLADIDTNYLTCADNTQNITITSGDASSAITPTITAENGTVGDIVNVTVSIPTNTNAAGGSFNLIYDNTKMELIDATAGNIIAAFSKTVNKTYAANKVRLNFAGSETVSASGGIILNASFKLTAAGTATFSTEKFKLADIDTNYLACENSDKSITISEAITTVLVTGVSLNKTSSILTVGDTETLTATVLPLNATNKNVTWTSSNTSVATIDNGVVTAKAAGTATITATTEDGNKTAACVVIVNAVNEDMPILKTEDITVRPGEEVYVDIVAENCGLVKAITVTDFEYSQSLTLTKAEWLLSGSILSSVDINGDSLIAFQNAVDANKAIMRLYFTVDSEATDEDAYIRYKAMGTDASNKNFEFVESEGKVRIRRFIVGDCDGDETITVDDAIYLAFYTFYPSRYPIPNGMNVDFDKDGAITVDDAIYLAFYTFYPDRYPLN